MINLYVFFIAFIATKAGDSIKETSKGVTTWQYHWMAC